MRSWFISVLGLAVACAGAGDVDEDTSSPTPGTPAGATTGPTTGTPAGTPTGTAAFQASCSPTANPLRFLCDVSVDSPQPVDVDFWIQGTTEEYTLSSEDVADQHQVMLYMMKPNTAYDWRASPRDDPGTTVTGTFTTGALTGGCDVTAAITGTSSASYIVSQSPCSQDANILVLDRDGDVVWCEDFKPTSFDSFIEGANLTEDDTFIAVVADHIIEKDLEGNELLRLARAVDYGEHVHHDVWRKDGLTYVLFNESVAWNNDTYTLDGFYVFDGTTQLGEWHLIDHFQPSNPASGWPGPDYSHSNALWTDGSGELLLSMRHLSTVASIDVDTTSPYFGEVNWAIAGEGLLSEFPSDYTITSSVGGLADFEQQHNAHFMATGQLAIFDNRDSISELSRMLRLDLDPATGTADIVEAYELPNHCAFQGGAWETVTGNPVATCAPSRTAHEWDVGQASPRWDMTLSCTNGLDTYTPRFQPWEGPW